MRQEDYAEIKDAVEKAGFFASFQPYDADEEFRWLIVLVSRCTEGRLHGNSFRLSLEQGQWHLITWSPVEYTVPAIADLTALCLECLRASGTPIPVVPPDIASRYGLQELPQGRK
jgi:hypothetical protein